MCPVRNLTYLELAVLSIPKWTVLYLAWNLVLARKPSNLFHFKLISCFFFFLIFRNLKHVEHFEYLVFYSAGSRTCGKRFSKSSLAENSKYHAHPIFQMIIREHLWAQLFEGRSISVNPVLNCNLDSSLFCLKSFSWINISLLFRASSHQIVDKMY